MQDTEDCCGPHMPAVWSLQWTLPRGVLRSVCSTFWYQSDRVVRGCILGILACSLRAVAATSVPGLLGLGGLVLHVLLSGHVQTMPSRSSEESASRAARHREVLWCQLRPLHTPRCVHRSRFRFLPSSRSFYSCSSDLVGVYSVFLLCFLIHPYSCGGHFQLFVFANLPLA